jgi:hypothetical protein
MFENIIGHFLLFIYVLDKMVVKKINPGAKKETPT